MQSNRHSFANMTYVVVYLLTVATSSCSSYSHVLPIKVLKNMGKRYHLLRDWLASHLHCDKESLCSPSVNLFIVLKSFPRWSRVSYWILFPRWPGLAIHMDNSSSPNPWKCFFHEYVIRRIWRVISSERFPSDNVNVIYPGSMQKWMIAIKSNQLKCDWW